MIGAGIPLEHGLILSAALFAVGLMGILFRRDIIFILMSTEILLNAAGVAFVVAGARWAQPDGQVMFVLILTLASAEVCVALALVMQMYKRVRSLDVDRASRMRG